MLVVLSPLTLPLLLVLAEVFGSAQLMATLSVLEDEASGAVQGGGHAPQTATRQPLGAFLQWVAALLRFRLCGAGGAAPTAHAPCAPLRHGTLHPSWNNSAAAAFDAGRLPLASAQLLYQVRSLGASLGFLPPSRPTRTLMRPAAPQHFHARIPRTFA